MHPTALGYAWMRSGGGVLPIMAYTGRFRPTGASFSGFRYSHTPLIPSTEGAIESGLDLEKM